MSAAVPRRIDLAKITVTSDLLKLLPADLMKRHLVVPFERQGEHLSVAMADPNNTSVLEQIRLLSGSEVDVFAAPAESIANVLEKAARELEKSAASNSLHIESSAGESTVVKTVEKLFELALAQRTSDIHLEPQSKALFVRFRIDGALHTVHQFPKAASISIISRIKIMAGMDISEKRLPQDGQINTMVNGKDLNLRVSTLAAKHGEKTVIRLLDKSAGSVDMGALGLGAQIQSHFETMVDKPQGLLLVTGPTGSGKTTTLYAVINRLKSPMKNIITLEDPIEYELLGQSGDEAGITQVQINSKINFTFAAGLRAALRQDPDVIMVGEIRDRETAETCLKAAMTGHLVLSTLHTNDAPSAIGRLRDLGVEPYMLASTLTGVMAQRLLRLLCASCKEAYRPPARAVQNLFPKHPSAQPINLYRPKGCDRCQGTGYWGRKGIYELLILNEAIRHLIHENAPDTALKRSAVSEGLCTLRESGLQLVYEGLTTVDEVFRHTVE